MRNPSPQVRETADGTADPRDPRASALLRRGEAGAPGGMQVIGLPYDGGIPSRPGARFGPRALRDSLTAFGSYTGRSEIPPMTDLGDLQLPTMNGSEAHRRMEDAARRAFSQNTFPIFIGGDHGCTGSIIRGFAAARPETRLALISIDAHLDVREYDDAASLSSGTPFRRALETAVLEGSRTAMIGLRPLANSRYYLDWARANGIVLLDVSDVAERGARELARESLQKLMVGADALYLSIDMDAIDAAFAPGVSAPGAGGLTAREAIDLIGEIASHPLLVGADIMELSPPYDLDGRTARLAARLLLEVVARRAGAPDGGLQQDSGR